MCIRDRLSTDTSITSNIISNTLVPVETDTIIEHTSPRNTESNLNLAPAKKKKKNKVIRSNCCIHLKRKKRTRKYSIAAINVILYL